ncbi:MAG: polyhydroxyalkanoate depolymerase [Burkholderiales bacterium]
MLYALHEMSHAALAPWQMWASMNANMFSHPFSPLSYSPFSRKIAAGSELFVRLTQRYHKPEFGISETLVGGKAVAIREAVVVDKPFCRLLHFERDLGARRVSRKGRADPVVLLVAPLSGHHATLLRDTVRTFLPDHEVYITDWVDARMVSLFHGPFHLDDYVDYVREFITFLGPEVNVISVCQPTVPVLAAISLMAEADAPVKPRTMIMMGGPIDARRSPTAVNNLATAKPLSWFKSNVIERVPAKYPGAMRLVYPGFLQHLGFVAMNPSRHADAHRDFYNHLVEGDGESAEAHRRFYDEYNAVLDMPAEYYLDTIRTVFQEFSLPKGRMFVREQLVRPDAISKTALLTVEGELDDISGNGQTKAAHALCTSIPAAKREHYLAPDVGHYGIFSGRRFRETLYPRIRDFIRRHG